MSARYHHEETPLSVGRWMLTIFLLAVPFVNLICYVFWALGGGGNEGRSNFARASVLWFFLILILYGILVGVSVLPGQGTSALPEALGR